MEEVDVFIKQKILFFKRKKKSVYERKSVCLKANDLTTIKNWKKREFVTQFPLSPSGQAVLVQPHLLANMIFK